MVKLLTGGAVTGEYRFFSSGPSGIAYKNKQLCFVIVAVVGVVVVVIVVIARG